MVTIVAIFDFGSFQISFYDYMYNSYYNGGDFVLCQYGIDNVF